MLLLAAFQFAAVAEVKLHNAPQGENKSESFTLKVNGKKVFVYECTVSKYPINQVWPGYQRPIEQTEKAAFAYWDMDEDGADIEITTNVTCRDVVVRPLSLGIRPTKAASLDDNVNSSLALKPKFVKNKIKFRLNSFRQVVVEVNGYHNSLHLFPNKMEKLDGVKKTDFCSPQCNYCSPAHNDISKKYDPNYIYFGAGRHDVGTLMLKSNTRVHIAAGAVVFGSLVADNAENIKITGRGILDGSRITRADKFARGGFGCLHFRNCKNVSVEGIILRDPNSWCVNVRRCTDVDIDNIKMIGLWRYNSDGIDVWDSSNVSFKNSFIRAFDDSFIIRADDINNKNITVENCAMWNDWGLSLAVWAWSKTMKGRSYENITFKNIDIIRSAGQAMHISNKSGSTVRNVKFENINVEYDAWCPRQIFQKRENRGELYMPDPNDKYVPMAIFIESVEKDSKVEDIAYENIKIFGRSDAPSLIISRNADVPVRNVTVKNLDNNGKKAATAEAANMRVKNGEVKFE